MAGSHTVVVGGGIVGISTAWCLARRGHRVTVLERGDIGSGASSGNAGIIAIGHPPLPQPGLVRQVLKWMLDGSSPLYVPPRFDLDLFRWLWEFRKYCTEQHFEYCMNILAELGRATRAGFEQMMADGLRCEYHRNGWREVYMTAEALDAGRRSAEVLRRHGFAVEELDGRRLVEREPAFVDGVAGAIEFPDSSFTDPSAFLAELARRAAEHGAVIRTHTALTQLVTDGGRVAGARLDTGERLEADTVVLAGGVWTTRLAARLGLRVPMQAGKGYHRNVTRPTPCLRVASVLAERHVAVTPMDDVLRLAGTVEFSGINDRLVQKRLDMLSASARQYLRGIGQTQTVSEWCGLRPCTADGLPVVGWAPRIGGLFIATGHARMGLTLAPITGRLAAECILDGAPSMDIAPLRADRFERGAAARVTPPAAAAPAGR